MFPSFSVMKECSGTRVLGNDLYSMYNGSRGMVFHVCGGSGPIMAVINPKEIIMEGTCPACAV